MRQGDHLFPYPAATRVFEAGVVQTGHIEQSISFRASFWNIEGDKTRHEATRIHPILPAFDTAGGRERHSFNWLPVYEDQHIQTIIQPKIGSFILNQPRQIQEGDGLGDPSSSYKRFRLLHHKIDKVGGKHSPENMKQTNECVKALGSGPGGKPTRTLWHALYDAEGLSLQVDFYLREDASAPGGQRRTGYLSFGLDNSKALARK